MPMKPGPEFHSVPLQTTRAAPDSPSEVEASGCASQDTGAGCLAIFTREGAAELPWPERIAAAEALAVRGDPRFPARRVGPEMLEVPPLSKEGRNYMLGKYPVTVEEYRRFLESDEYGDVGLWDAWAVENPGRLFEDEGGTPRPSDWDSQLPHLNWPVAGVSWYEARAYCRWLTRLSKVEFRLPSSEERGVAVGWPGREYPWGDDEPTPELANYEPNVMQASPVGVYPSGAGPFGHLDLAGNVWEWCEDRDEDGDPYLRSGCWSADPLYLRSWYLAGYRDRYRNESVGFRVCSFPPSPVP